MNICAYLLSIKDVVVAPELADAEALVKPTILVGFCEEPRCIHEILALEGPHDFIAYSITDSGRHSPWKYFAISLFQSATSASSSSIIGRNFALPLRSIMSSPMRLMAWARSKTRSSED